MQRFRLTIAALAAASSLVASLSVSTAVAGTSQALASCSLASAPSSLGKTLLALHRTYERHQPGVHNPTITGPVGRIDVGVCGAERYALAWFNARYNGIFFGTQDQPERFTEPLGGAWRDIGNTGGDPCGAAPTALLKAWKIVRSCPA